MRLKRILLFLATTALALMGALTTPALASAAAPAAATATTPTWTFTVRVGLPTSLVTKYGGLAATKTKVNSQFALISSRFTGFAATIKFVATSFYTFTGSPPPQTGTPHPNADFLVVYDEGNDQGGWEGWVQAILHDWPADQGGVFSSDATWGLQVEFAHSRGAIDNFAEDVTATSNPISGMAYNAPPSVMTYFYTEHNWDPYTRGIVNASGTQIYSGAPIVDRAFPSKIRIVAQTSTGAPVAGAKVNLYPVGWYTYTVGTQPVMSGTTGQWGYFVLPSNPFNVNGGPDWGLQWCNFLVQVVTPKGTSFAWLPLTAVGGWYFTHPGQAFTRYVSVAGLDPSTPSSIYARPPGRYTVGGVSFFPSKKSYTPAMSSEHRR